jgi:ABC-2 type transport system ATP-binding protein
MHVTIHAIETHDLHKTYHTFLGKRAPALKGVSLSVESGRVFGLIGPNGAGKTSLVKILLGLSVPSGGSARLLGGDPGSAAVRRRVGYLPEAMRLPEFFDAQGFVEYMGELNGVAKHVLRQRVPELLALVGLAGVRKPVKQFSKGMLQRLGMAQALVNDPEVLFLDEPTDGLDPAGRKEVRDLLVRLRGQGKTVFLNSHLLSEIEMVCDQIAILDRGEVARTGTPAEFTRGRGEVLIRVAEAGTAVRDAAAAVGTPTWEGRTLRFIPRDRAHLNAMIDRLRAVQVEIEAVEPSKQSLEQSFLEIVKGADVS